MNTDLTRVGPKRDRYGRYLIPDPATGRERAWTRATTLADTLDDRYNLELWKLRTAATGFAHRPDLLALVAAHQGDKKALDRVCADALEAGKAGEGANLGTALHALTERIDRGEDALVIDSLRADVEAYRKTLAESGLTIATLPDGRLAREVIVLCPELEVAGTADHLFAGDKLTVGDLKTGASAIDWAMNSIAIQLAIYAHATHIFDPTTDTLTEMPPVDLERALVIHLPVGSGECTLHEVDIAAGWEAAQHAAWVRGWRKRKGLSKPRATVVAQASTPDDPFDGVSGNGPLIAGMSPQKPTAVPSPAAGPAGPSAAGEGTASPAPAALPRVEWIAERIAQLPPAGLQLLTVRWPADVVRPPKAQRASGMDYDDDELAAIEAVLMPIEREHECPFVPNPTLTPDGWATQAGEQIAAAGEAADREAAEGSPGPLATSPAPAPDEGDQVTDEDIAAVAKAFDELEAKVDSSGSSPHLFARSLLKEMADAGSPLSLTKVRSRRRWSIARAVLGFAPYDDEIARACLAVVLGDEVPESVTTGVAFAALTIDEADRLTDMAQALDAGSLHAVYADDGALEIRAA